MKRLPFLPCAIALTALILPAAGEEDAAAAFAGMLRDAVLEGSWAPLSGNRLGAEKPDRYEVARAEAKSGDRWVIVWKVRRQGQVVEYPLPARVVFAGDTAVLILDEVPAGEGKVWSARVLFHRDTYAGRWWGRDGEGGTVTGTVARPRAG